MPKRTISCRAHDLFWSDKSQSVSSRAYDRDEWVWRMVVLIVGRKHCEKSWCHYHGVKFEGQTLGDRIRSFFGVKFTEKV